MKILAIETSCDETAISVVEADGGLTAPQFKILSHQVASQIATHAPFGGVVPSVAKREHGRLLIPLLKSALTEASLTTPGITAWPAGADELLAREPELAMVAKKFFAESGQPTIDAIAVTVGPGLEPALWVGLNLAKLLSAAWARPFVPVNHLEGHIVSVLLEANNNLAFPTLALIISGGHTELVLATDFHHYERLGATRDDAVGEAFDKVARLLGLPYPGGPALSQLASQGENFNRWHLPRPMIDSPDLDFSFSGLKTAVRYAIQKHGELNEADKKSLAREFEDAVIEVLLGKTLKALTQTGAKSLIIGGGVIANTRLRAAFAAALADQHPSVPLHLPTKNLSTDNATMIALAGYLRFVAGEFIPSGEALAAGGPAARGNLSLK